MEERSFIQWKKWMRQVFLLYCFPVEKKFHIHLSKKIYMVKKQNIKIYIHMEDRNVCRRCLKFPKMAGANIILINLWQAVHRMHTNTWEVMKQLSMESVEWFLEYGHLMPEESVLSGLSTSGTDECSRWKRIMIQGYFSCLYQIWSPKHHTVMK